MSDTGAPIKCLGCEWDGYTHSHIEAEDGPRSTCCDHSCGRPNAFPTARLAWDESIGDLRVVVEPAVVVAPVWGPCVVCGRDDCAGDCVDDCQSEDDHQAHLVAERRAAYTGRTAR